MRRTAFLILFSVALLGCCALFLLHNEEAVNLSNIVKLETPGDFIVHSSERIPKENVTSMIVADGMIPKLTNSFKAIDSGVSKVIIKHARNLLNKKGTTLK